MTYLVTEDEKSQQSIEEKSVAHFSNSFKHYHNVHIHTHLKKKKKVLCKHYWRYGPCTNKLRA